MRYIPHTPEDIRQMLSAIGVEKVEDLFSPVPEKVRLKRDMELPGPFSEAELLMEIKRLSRANAEVDSTTSFLGGGAYNHFIPAVVDHLISRSEFYTAYTPYQPEISQGTLQMIFEYQSLICQLTGMEVANASMYDGATACAEAVLMAVRTTRRKKVLISAGLHPEWRRTVETYCRYLELELHSVPLDEAGQTDAAVLESLLDSETACLVAGYPNFFGVIENLEALFVKAAAKGALGVAAVQEPVALGLLKSPGELGADIVVGEGQSFGIPLSFGGPGLGFFAAKEKLMRTMPGRLVGRTRDLDGNPGFVLTLATREQHIRREKATSNICSNQGLCALMAAIYLCLVGKRGLRDLASQNLAKAAYAKERLCALPGVSMVYTGATFNEFALKVEGDLEALLEKLAGRKLLAGIHLRRFDAARAGQLLVCVTEQNSREQIDALVDAMAGGMQ